MIICISALTSCGQTTTSAVKPPTPAPAMHDSSQSANGMKLLMAAYPEWIAGIGKNEIVFNDKSTLPYDDGKRNKSWDDLLNKPSLRDQFYFGYKRGTPLHPPAKNEDPGRIRNEAFFKKMYGNTEEEVKKNLVEIAWLPNTANQKVRITKINKVNEKLIAVSNELDKHPALTKYLKNIGGTFKWRYIKGTKRLSEHSFGIAIDINTSFSNYWMWDCKCSNEQDSLHYSNRIPLEIVNAFEKQGFIWGGKWYHYDTMHFEYRPELLR